MRALVFACALLGGCALLQPPPEPDEPLGPGEILSAHAAQDLLTIGKSTRSDVLAALGEAVVVDFASGYEVWVYRERPKKDEEEEAPTEPTELVLLFEPSGVLAKTRVR